MLLGGHARACFVVVVALAGLSPPFKSFIRAAIHKLLEL